MSIGGSDQIGFRSSCRQRTARTAPAQAGARARAARLEALWAWASLLVLIVCWDAAFRLDEQVSLPRMRIAHAVDQARNVQRVESIDP